jgi:hypothetical protein
LLSTANEELEELSLAPEDPVELAPAALAPAAPLDEPPLLEELLLVEAFVVPVAETVSPTSPERVTIVPSSGAYSLVF